MIYTFQSSDKNEFDKQVNFYLSNGCTLMENGYNILEIKGQTIYSQVLKLEKCKGEMDSKGNLTRLIYSDERFIVIYNWYENGQMKSSEKMLNTDGDGYNGRLNIPGYKGEFYYKEYEGLVIVEEWQDNGGKIIKAERNFLADLNYLVFKCYYESGRLHSQGTFFNHLTVDDFGYVTERPTFVGRYYKYSDDEKNDLLEESDYEYIEND